MAKELSKGSIKFIKEIIEKTNNALILYKYKNERVEVDECLWQGLMKKF